MTTAELKAILRDPSYDTEHYRLARALIEAKTVLEVLYEERAQDALTQADIGAHRV